jgi:hypothetical protein
VRALVFLLTVALAWAPVAVLAQPPAPPPRTPAGDDRIVALRLGAVAPFEGQLLDTDTAIRWTLRMEWYRLELQRQYDLRISDRQLIEDSWSQRLELTEASYMREIEGLRGDTRDIARDLARAQNPGFFRTAVGGFVIGVGVCFVLAIAGYVLYRR